MAACVTFLEMIAGISKCINALSKIETRNTTNVVALCVAMHTPCTQFGSSRTARTYRKNGAFGYQRSVRLVGGQQDRPRFSRKLRVLCMLAGALQQKHAIRKKNVEIWQQSGRVIYKAFTQYKG